MKPAPFLTLLRGYIKRHGISEREASRRLGVSNASISNWLHERNAPNKVYIAHLLPLLRK